MASAVPFFGRWVMAEWLRYSLQRWMAVLFVRTRVHGFVICIQHMKQFVHIWNLPCCQCTETRSHVSVIQESYIYKPVPGVSAPLRTFPDENCSMLYPMCDTTKLVSIPLLVDHLWPSGFDAQHSSGRWRILWDPGARNSLLASSTWSNSLTTEIFPAASTRRYGVMSPSYRNSTYGLYSSSKLLIYR